MAGIQGNNAWWMFKKQSAQGAIATLEAGEVTEAPKKQKAFRVPFSGGSLAPNRVFGKLAETDSSRDQGVSYAKTGGVAGTPETYVRDDSIAGLLLAVLGTDTPTGTTPNFVHKITPATVLPYFTVWNAVGSTLYEAYKDCKVSSVNIKTTAGEPLTCSANIIGVSAEKLGADPTTTVKIPLDASYVYNYNDALVELPIATPTSKISSFDMTINNNVTPQQTDSFTPLDVIAGIRQIDLAFDLIFENTTEYGQFNYAGGSTESNKLYTTSALFKFEKSGSANNSVQFEFPSIAYETYPIAPNVTGAPIVVSVKAVAQRHEPIMEATVKNQVEAY